MDEKELEHLYAEHWREVPGYALRRTGSPADAADVTSEVFPVAWRRRDQVPGRADFRPWLYGVARNVLLNHRRGGRRRERLSALLLSAVDEQAQCAWYQDWLKGSSTRPAADQATIDAMPS